MRRLAASGSTLLACALITSGCDSSTAPGSPGAVEAFAGTGQSAVVGNALGEDLAVRVLDTRALPRGGVRVTWTVAGGGGTVAPASSLTGLNGIARTSLRLGTTAGANAVTATVEGLPGVVFSALGTPDAPATVLLSPTALFSDVVGSTQSLTATVQDRHGNVVPGTLIAWSSSNEAVATVSGTGVVTFTGRGGATITATAAGASGGVEVTVPVIASVLVVPDSATLRSLGATWQFGAIVRDDRGVQVNEALTWTSLAPGVATVDATGRATAVGNGTTRIVVAAGGRADTATVVVAQAPASITVTPASRVLTPGATLQLAAAAVDAGGSPITGLAFQWTSGNPAAATVSGTGLVTAVGRGSAVVTAAAGGMSGTSTIQVALAFSTVDAGAVHTCGTSPLPGGGANVTYCWGSNQQGRLGDGTNVDRSVPTQIPGSLVFSTVSAGGFHSCGIATDGTTHCWGAGGNGQLGNLGTADVASPSAVPTPTSFDRISAGTLHTCALTAGDDAYCWGNDQYGQLGLGGTLVNCAPGVPCHTSPQLVPGGLKFRTISAGLRHTCGTVRTTGDVYCWGYNGSGELGTGDVTPSGSPRLVTGISGATSVTVGEEHSCAVLSTGAVYCWGANEAGQLGRGNALASSPDPLLVSLGENAVGVTTGLDHSCAWTAGGTAFCWGLGTSGQLGAGYAVSNPAPGVVSGGLQWSNLSAGREFTCGIAGGILYCWGANSQGQLGLGDSSVRLIPTRVVDPL